MLATRFSRQRTETRSDAPLSDDSIRRYAPSIYAEAAHGSRSERYTYIPTAAVLAGLRKEGFQPFMVAQSKSRDEGRREFTKHMIRLRHDSQIARAEEANEIILVNSHDGTSSYQMLAGCFRFVCANGLIVGDKTADIRVPHKGDVGGRVIEGAYRVLEDSVRVSDNIDRMKSLGLSQGEQLAFGRAALALRYEEGRAPVTEHQLIEPRRRSDVGADLWSVFNRVQENVIRGDQAGRRPSGERVRTRSISGIDQSVKLNRALWVLADELQRLRA